MASPNYHAAMKNHYGAMSSAFAALAAGEPDAEAKLGEAHQQLCAGHQQFASEHPDEAEDTSLLQKLMAQHEAGKETPTGGEGGDKPQEYSADDLAGMSDQQFAAEATENPLGVLQGMRKAFCVMAKENQTLKTKQSEDAAASARKAARDTFQKFCSDHSGQEFSADDMLAAFDAANGDEKVAASLRSLIEKAPAKASTPADMGQVFSADDAIAVVPDPAKPAPGGEGAMQFSADEAKAGTDALDALGL